LIQRVFAFALQVKLSLQGEELWHPIDHDVLDKKIKHFLKKGYLKAFAKFKARFIPVTIPFHNVGDGMRKYLENDQAIKDLTEVSDNIRRYRNIIVHSLPPIKLINQNRVSFLPELKFLEHYQDARWSSGNLDLRHFAP